MQTFVKVISTETRQFQSVDRLTGASTTKSATSILLTDGVNTMVGDYYGEPIQLMTNTVYSADLRFSARKSQDGRLFNTLTIANIVQF